jgi:hypothetical protein
MTHSIESGPSNPDEQKGENQKEKEMLFIMYTAEFVKDAQGLLKKFPPKHEKAYGHHSTIAFKPESLEGIEIGKKSLMKIIARAYDEKGDALLVENSKSKNENPHITLSCATGISPVYSNELLKKAIESGTIEYLNKPVA